MKNKTYPKKWELRKFYTVDIETYIKTMEFRLMTVFTRDKNNAEVVYEYKHISDFFKEFLTQSRYYGTRKYVFYAHFGGGFDFYYFLEVLFDVYTVKDFKTIVAGSNMLTMSFSIKGVKFVFNDSYALFRASLKKVIKALCNTKKLMDLSVVSLDKFGDRRVFEYCLQDSRQLYDALINYNKMIEFPIALTAASLSMDIFKTDFLRHQWPKIGESYERDIRQWQHAGRVDVFKRYGKDISFFDINNFYPSVMQANGAPIGLPRLVTKINKRDEIAGFYQVRLTEFPEETIPFMPVKLEHKLIFVNSTELDYFITTHEIELLDEYGYKYNVIRGYEFELDTGFFEDYVTYWNDKRNESPDYKFLAKNMLNHLSGKFSQKSELTSIEQGDKLEADEWWLSEEYKIKSKPKKVITDFMNPQISTWIWSGARTKLWEYLKLVEHDGLCYCDTDSVVCETRKFPKALLDKNTMGKFKNERNCKEAIFLAPKMYGFVRQDDVFDYKIKGFDVGFREHTITNVTEQLFRDKLANKEVEFTLDTKRIEKIKTVIKKSSWLLFTKHSKKIINANIKRRLDADGIGTKPFTYINGGLV